jgi:hypothetical protein
MNYAQWRDKKKKTPTTAAATAGALFLCQVFSRNR